MTTSAREELHATITARAELDRTFARQLVEEASSVMAKSLMYLLDQTTSQATEQVARFEQIVKDAIRSQLGVLSERVAQMDVRLDEHGIAIVELRDAIAARPTPAQAHVTYRTMRWLVEQAGGDPDALGLPQVGDAKP